MTILLCIFIYSKTGSANTIDGIVLYITSSMVGEVNVLEEGYSENSIASLLIPSNISEYFLFGFIKSFIYILPVLPSSWSIPSLSVSISGLILTALFPGLLSGISIQNKFVVIKYFLVVLLVLLLTVGYSIASMIHLRYRIMYDLLFLFLAFICFKCASKIQIRNCYFLWGGLCLFGLFVYLSIKMR